ncbi:hypothetical protein ABZ016_04715 [Streptomyces sp. NPDC006372]|uniref:hypothetical protein n=1 Tax=Streptomyces sp. NPDC006372 TaxID=3155599 RepID=UPI0033AAB9FE
MADEQYRWLDRETAERLLNGEPLEAVDGAAPERAERLARTLDALSASPPLTSEELPGEAAAMAAFRKASAERADAAGARSGTGEQTRRDVDDAGLVRIGAPRGSGSGADRRPRWARPARLALAAVLAVGMVGGVAVAAGTGVLKAPFGDEPQPGASVSADVTPPERPLISPSPSDAVQGGSTPDDAPGGTSTGGAGGSGRTGDRDDAAPKPGSGDRGDRPRDGHGKVATACRDLREGKRLNGEHRRALRDAAGGSRVWKYCKGVLAGADGRATQRGHGDANPGKHANNSKGASKGKGANQGRKQDKAERKAEREAQRKAQQRAERQGTGDGHADRGRSARSE